MYNNKVLYLFRKSTLNINFCCFIIYTLRKTRVFYIWGTFFNQVATGYSQACCKLLTCLLYKLVETTCYSIVTAAILQTVSKLVQVCQQAATSLSQHFVVGSAKTSCWQVVGKALLQVCYMFVTNCTFLCVYKEAENSDIVRL